MGNGPHYGGYGSGPPPPRKTKLELARNMRDIRLDDLRLAANRFTKACEDYEIEKKVARTPCSCQPVKHGQCDTCGGTK